MKVDALGRTRSRTVGTTSDTYAYAGPSQTIYGITNAATTKCLIGASGERLATLTGSAFGWTIYDLHGNIVGIESAAGSLTDAFRFDAYGQTVASGGSGSGVSSAWRYQGRLDVSPNSDPLYVAGARLYAPSVGTFTSLDSYGGSAADPASMNRFLYTEANPATLVDPDGHSAVMYDWDESIAEHPTACGGGGPGGEATACSRSGWRTKVADVRPIVLTLHKTWDGYVYLTDEDGAFVGDSSDRPLVWGDVGGKALDSELDLSHAIYLAGQKEDAWCAANADECKSIKDAENSQNAHILLGLCSLLIITPAAPAGAGCSAANAVLYATEGKPVDAVLAGLPAGGYGLGKAWSAVKAIGVEPIYDGTPLGPEAPAVGGKVVGGDSAAAAFGRETHGQFNQVLKTLAKDDPGSWKPAATTGADRPDGFFLGDPMELKPNTPSGLSAGLSQLKRYMTAFGSSQSYLYVYDEYGNITLLKIVTP